MNRESRMCRIRETLNSATSMEDAPWPIRWELLTDDEAGWLRELMSFYPTLSLFNSVDTLLHPFEQKDLQYLFGVLAVHDRENDMRARSRICPRCWEKPLYEIMECYADAMELNHVTADGFGHQFYRYFIIPPHWRDRWIGPPPRVPSGWDKVKMDVEKHQMEVLA